MSAASQAESWLGAMAFPYLFADESQASFCCDGGFASVFPQAALECGSCVGYFVTTCLSDNCKLTSADLKTYELLVRLTDEVLGIDGCIGNDNGRNQRSTYDPPYTWVLDMNSG